MDDWRDKRNPRTPFWERFTEYFLGHDEAARSLFEHVPPAHRRELLQRSFSILLEQAERDPGTRIGLDQLLRPDRHDRRPMSEQLYRQWLEALTTAVRECDPRLPDAVERAWLHATESAVRDLLKRGGESGGDAGESGGGGPPGRPVRPTMPPGNLPGADAKPIPNATPD